MSAVVGIDVGAYKHAAAVCRAGNVEAERNVFRLSADRAGFDELDRWLERQGSVERWCWSRAGTITGRWLVTFTGVATGLQL